MQQIHVAKDWGTLYTSYVRSALTYGGECWALRIEDEKRLLTTEMRMLRLICGMTLKNKIINEKVRELAGVDEMKEFLRGQRFVLARTCGKNG